MTVFDVIRYSKQAVQCIRVTLYRFCLVYDLDGQVDQKDNTICKISSSGVTITLLSHVQIRYTDIQLPIYHNCRYTTTAGITTGIDGLILFFHG